MTGVNYVVVSWSGRRRVNPKRYVEDPSSLLRLHLESLERLRHHLAQVTLVVNRNPDEHPLYRKAIQSLPSKLGCARLDVVERDNVGYSYGAYADVYERFRTSFQYYILMEDDYRFMVDDFDQVMMGLLDRSGAGFLTFLLRKATKSWICDRARRESPRGPDVAATLERLAPDSFVYPQVCLGMARARTLEDVRLAFGRLPHSSGASHSENKFEGQFALVAAIQKAGWTLADAATDYRVKEHDPQGRILPAGPDETPFLVEPIQPLL